MKPETLLTQKIMKRLKRLPYSHWEKIQQEGKRGTADIIGTFLGIAYHIEVKHKFKPIRSPREMLQLYKMGQNCKALGRSYIWHSTNWEWHINRMERAAHEYAQRHRA